MTDNPEHFDLSQDNPDIILDSKPWFDLSHYQGKFDRKKPKWFIFLWWLIEGIIFPLTPHTTNNIRVKLLRLFGAKIGKGVVIRPSARFLFPWKVEIGDYSWIGDSVYLYSLDQITIGCHSIISQKCYLCTGSHDINDTHFALLTAPISIGNGVWVATDCFIAPGVKIGANTIIGARSSVFKSITSGVIAWGSPCKAHKIRPPISS